MKIDLSDVLILAGLIALAVYLYLLAPIHLVGGAGLLLLFAGVKHAQRGAGE